MLISVGYELHESRGKTRTARRTIDLDERTIAILTAITAGREHDDYVFCHDDGTPIHPHVVSDAFKKLVARSALPRIRFHDLRHTHATLLLKAGVPIKVAANDSATRHPGSRWRPTNTSSRHVTRSRAHLRRDPRPVYRFHPVEHPVEHNRTRRGPALGGASDLRLRWWRGEDLNLRPSGYEPDELPDCSTPRRGGAVYRSAVAATKARLAQERGRLP